MNRNLDKIKERIRKEREPFRQKLDCKQCSESNVGWCKSCAAAAAASKRKSEGKTTNYPKKVVDRDLISRMYWEDRFGDKKWEKPQCLSYLKSFVKRNGYIPTVKDWKRTEGKYKQLGMGVRSPKPSHSTIVRLFGSWNNFISAAGFPTKKRKNW